MAVILTPELAGYMLDEWAMRRHLPELTGGQLLGKSVLESALERCQAPVVRRSTGAGIKKPNWKRPR